MCDEKLPAGHLPADQVGDVPPLLGRDDQIEVVPFAPGGIRCCRRVEVIQLIVELLERGIDVAGVGRRVAPGAGAKVQGGTDGGGAAGNLAACSRGHNSLASLEVDEL